MAATEAVRTDPVVPVVGSPCPETTKESSSEALMEKLRSKAGQYKSWVEMSKTIRVAITEKRHLMNSGERTQLQKVLDTLQKSIKVSSLQSMVERLDSITRQQGLKFTSGPPNTECYIFSDMFYVEVLLETTGAVKDVKIAHQGEPVSCPELVKVLKAGNFSEFTKHLEGLASIYQLNAEKKQKSEAYLALQALEVDLSMLAQLQSSIIEPSNLVHKSPVGILQQRRGGYSLKLTYFISPYDLIDVEKKTTIPLTVDAVVEKGLGHSVTVCIESSTSHKLQTCSLISVSKTAEGKNHPSFAALNKLNCTTLPANFVLKLPKPMPISICTIKKIVTVTSSKVIDYPENADPILSVIVNDTSNGKLSVNDQGLYVTLPDQHHCYFLNSSPDLQGVMVSSIPFTHPTHVPQILVFLRQQMLFNTLINSCIRPGSKKDAESPFMFEIMAYSISSILVSFEHPLEESLATVDLDLKDITNVKCKIYTLSSDATMCTDEYASKIMQRCLSIPITMRAVIRKAQGQQQLMRSSNQGDMYCAAVSSSGSVPYLSHIPNYENSLTNGSSFSGGDFSNLASRMCNKPADGDDIGNFAKNISSGQASENSNFNHTASSGVNADTSSVNSHNLETDIPSNGSNNIDNFSPNMERSKNSLSNSLQNGSSNQFQQKRHANTMLMSMLSDVPSANSSSSSFPFLAQSDSNSCSSSVGGKPRKRKRKTDNRSPGGATGRSPKRKLSEDDLTRDRSTPDAEMCDSPIGYDASVSLPASLPSASSEHNLNRTPGSVDSLKTGSLSPGFPQRSASTDSYLIHDDFQSRQVLNINDSSHLSEGGTPNSSDLIRNLPQVKSQYFGTESVEFSKDFLASAESSYGEQSAASNDADIDDENSFHMDSSQCSSVVTKYSSGEKPSKKKKSKEKTDSENNSLLIKIQDNNSSDESSVGDVSQKSFSEAENSQSEDISIVSSKSSTQPIIISTSLKIAKSGDGHKVSKTEMKIKQKEGKRSASSGDSSENSGKKKSDAKKERKRKRAENAEITSNRSPVRSLHLNIDSSLMPPPSSSSETAAIISSDPQTIRPITLNVKASPSVTSSSGFQSKSPVHSKKSSSFSSVSGTFSKSSVPKSSTSEKAVKPSPPRSSHFPSIKVSSSDSESKKSSGPTTVKIQSKHKQSSSSKSTSGGSSGSVHSSGRSSPSKPKSATLKLKHFGLPSSFTLTPIVSKTTITSPTCTQSALTSSDPLIMQAAIMTPGSPGKTGSNSSKANKSALRSRKSGVLNAVIDKLRVNAEHNIPDGIDSSLYESIARSEATGDRKESKLERKDNCKDSRDSLSLSKGTESKSKYSSSDQFTVKQSSQGIKLTVTKTRSSDGSSKSSKSKQSTKSSSVVSSSSSSSVGKATSSSNSSILKSGNVSPASKKLYSSSSSPNVSVSTKLSNMGSSQAKLNASSQKISSPSSLSSATSPRSGSSANNLSKSVSKHISSSSQNKVSGSSKVFEKSDKKSVSTSDSKSISSEAKEKVSTSTLNVVTSLMPPPPLSKSVSDVSRLSSSVPLKRLDDTSRQSPRHTPTREITVDESEGERAFRLLLGQSKSESSNGAENVASKSSEFISGATEYCKVDLLKKAESDDKGQWVSSSSDIKPSSVQRSSIKINPEQIILDDTNCIDINEIECKQTSQVEVSSSKKDNVVNANIVTSSEEITKVVAPLSKSIKQSKRTNGLSDEDSSPDECLVIDYPDTPRLQISPDEKWPRSSPRLDPGIVLNVLDDKIEKSEMSSSTFAISQPSLIKSPAQVITPSNHSLTRPLSLIDDDLMNEAVMPIEK